MSVHKSKRKVSSMQFVDTAYELEKFTILQSSKIPKRYSFTLTNEITNLAGHVHNHVRSGNSVYPTNKHEAQMRKDYFIRAQNTLQALSGKINLLAAILKENNDSFKNFDNTFENWGRLISEEAKLISGIINSDNKRFSKLFV